MSSHRKAPRKQRPTSFPETSPTVPPLEPPPMLRCDLSVEHLPPQPYTVEVHSRKKRSGKVTVKRMVVKPRPGDVDLRSVKYRWRQSQVEAPDSEQGIYRTEEPELKAGEGATPPQESPENRRIIESCLDNCLSYLDAAAGHKVRPDRLARDGEEGHELYRDAALGVCLAVELKGLVETGEASKLTVALAIDLGRLVERVAVRAHEPAAREGARVKRGRRKGGAKTGSQRHAESLQAAEKIVAAWNAARDANPSDKLGNLDWQIAHRFETTPRAVRRARLGR